MVRRTGHALGLPFEDHCQEPYHCEPPPCHGLCGDGAPERVTLSRRGAPLLGHRHRRRLPLRVGRSAGVEFALEPPPPPLVGAPQHRRSGRKRPALFSRHRLGARRRLAHQPGYSSACGFTGGASSDTRPASCCPRGGVKRPTGGAAAPVPGPSVSDVGVPARGHHSNAHAPPLPRSPTHHRGRSTPATVACIGGSGSMTASGGGDWRAVIGACDAAAARREVARLRWTAPRHVR